MASLGCYNDNDCNSRISKNKHFACKSLEFDGLREYFLNSFVINCHLGGHLFRILVLFFIWLQAKSLLLDSNFIANNFKKKMSLIHFFISHTIFTYNWPPSWTPSWIYRNTQ